MISTRDIMRKLDALASPVIEYRNYRFLDQSRHHLYGIRKGSHPFRSAVRLLHLWIQVAISLLATPLCAIGYLGGYRFLMVDLTQIGSILWLDLYLREALLAPRPPPRFVVARSRFTDANPVLLDLYRHRVLYVRAPLLKALTFHFFVNPFFRLDTFRFQEILSAKATGQVAEGRAHEVHATFARRHGIVAKWGAEEDNACMRGLATLGLTGKPYVCVHVREPGFYAERRWSTRNADIDTYEPAIRYLLEQGYRVVRMGDPSMKSIDGMITRLGPGLIDYARADQKSAFLDVALIRCCAFFVGSGSGLYAVAVALNKPMCWVNHPNVTTALGYLRGDLTTCKRVVTAGGERIVSFREMLAPPLSLNPTYKTLESLGYRLLDNSPEEILGTLREFLAADRHTTRRQQQAKGMLPPTAHSRGGLGDFSETFLGPYTMDFA